MKVSNHRLLKDDGSAYAFVRSPNVGGGLVPRWLVMHYTADGGGTAVDWFTNSDARASAHLVISRDGGITQMVPFDRVAWHAGKSEWRGVSGLNSHSIGIEMVNYGELHRHPQKGWMRYWRQNDGSYRWIGPAVPEPEVQVDGSRTIGGQRLDHGWQQYTPAQRAAALEVARAIVAAYRLDDVVGHEEISPGRKVDPGPAFGLAKFRERAMGREPRQPGPLFTVTTTLNVHAGPALTHPMLGTPLLRNTVVEQLEAQGGWKRVEAKRDDALTGWVPDTFLTPATVPVSGVPGQPAPV